MKQSVVWVDGVTVYAFFYARFWLFSDEFNSFVTFFNLQFFVFFVFVT